MLFLAIFASLSSTTFASAARLPHLIDPPVSQATCPSPVETASNPPGSVTTPVAICLGQTQIPLNTPEVVALLQTRTYKELFHRANLMHGSKEQPLKVIAAQFVWSGVSKSVSVVLANATPVGSISGQIKLDRAGKVIIVDVSSSVGVALPHGGASVGNH